MAIIYSIQFERGCNFDKIYMSHGWMHAVALMPPLTFAIVATPVGVFRPSGGAFYCWIPKKASETQP
jgi:hypothetical protein